MTEEKIRAFVNRVGEADLIEVGLTSGQVYRGRRPRICCDQLQFEQWDCQPESFRLVDVSYIGWGT